MKPPNRQLLFWLPRILTLLFAGFLSLFALDVFDQGDAIWKTVAAFMMHLIPTGVVLIVLALAWRWERIGAIGFATLGVLYAAMAWPHLAWILIISGPFFLIAVLFLLGWRNRKAVPATS